MDYLKRDDLSKYEQKILEMASKLESSFWEQLKEQADQIPDIDSAKSILLEAVKHSIVWMSMKYVLGFEKTQRLAILDHFVQHVKLNVMANLSAEYEEGDD